jgi:TonB family protein
MRRGYFLSVVAFALLTTGVVSGNQDSSDKYHTFYGDVIAINPSSITIKSGGKRLVFQINSETKIGGRDRPLQLDQIKPGDGATVVMQLGKGGVGIAVRVWVDAGTSLSSSLKLYAARTVGGGVISGMAINNYVAYQPPYDGWSGGPTLDQSYHAGVYLLEVRPDGNVGTVKVVKSMGYSELDLHAIRWFKRWRFKPNSVTEVQMPLSYMQSRWRF